MWDSRGEVGRLVASLPYWQGTADPLAVHTGFWGHQKQCRRAA